MQKIKNKYIQESNSIESSIINILIIVVISIILLYIRNKVTNNNVVATIKEENVSAFSIPEKTIIILKKLSDDHDLDFFDVLSVYSIENSFYKYNNTTPTIKEVEDEFLMDFDKLKYKYSGIYPSFSKIFESLFKDMKYFPIPESIKNYEYTYSDNFRTQKIYNKETTHLGIDIIDKKNIRGSIPIVSMTDGVIQDIGWDNSSGFRIGIISSSKNYYSYYHFDSINTSLKKTDTVVAGQFLGYMGDTGYKIGKRDNLAVNLHVAIKPYTKIFKNDFWINPFAFLKLIENKKAIFVK